MPQEYTPTPWTLSFRDTTVTHGDTIVAFVLTAHDMGKVRDDAASVANAAHIVRCVNAHDALVAALREALPFLCSHHGDNSDALEHVTAALALAEGREP